MDRQPLTMLGTALLVGAVLASCKREPPPAPTPTGPTAPRVSPVPNRPFTGELKAPSFPDLSVAAPDAGPKKTTVAATPKPAATDAGAAASAAAEAQRKTAKAFDQVLTGAKGALKGCIDAGASGTGEAKLSIRLRSGAVAESKVSGVPASVGSCISNVLQTLSVRDGASITIERGIKYSEPKK